MQRPRRTATSHAGEPPAFSVLTLLCDGVRIPQAAMRQRGVRLIITGESTEKTGAGPTLETTLPTAGVDARG